MGVKTRLQYHFPVKSFDKIGTFRQMKKLAVSLISSPTNVNTQKKQNMIIKVPIGCIAVYEFIIKLQIRYIHLHSIGNKC